MSEQVLSTSTLLQDWVQSETVHTDIVASWEGLCSNYEAMRFTDPLTDMERLEEFRWIVHNMNSFLSKIRRQLMTCQDEDAMLEVLSKALNPTHPVDLSTRKALAYQKMKQQWLIMTARKLEMMKEGNDLYGSGYGID